MLLSMTGHGEAQRQQDQVAVAVEVRTINGRYFKLSVRTGEGLTGWERCVEPVVRRFVRRGSVQVVLQIDLPAKPDNYRINGPVIAGYVQQIAALGKQLKLDQTVGWPALLALPGVVDEGHAGPSDMEAIEPIVEQTLLEALGALQAMRTDEGQAMAKDLAENCGEIAGLLEQIEKRAPTVVEAYRARLTERLNQVLAEYEVNVEPSDVVRDVGIFADRADIAEETVRMRSHLEQFQTIMQLPESNGRKLEFLTQEMFRETNTIGSKANDAEIAQRVVEIKACIERMREMIQNIE